MTATFATTPGVQIDRPAAPAPPPRLVAPSDDLPEHQRAIIEHAALLASANAILITDHTGAVLWLNPACERLTGFTLEELRGKYTRVLKSGAQDPRFYAELWSTITAGHVWKGVLRNQRRDGSMYDEELTISPVMVAGHEGPAYYIAFKEDVSERLRHEQELRHSEQRFRLLIESGADLVMLIRRDGRLAYASPSTCIALGCRPEELTGEALWSRIHPDDAGRATQCFFGKVIDGGADATCEFRVRHTDGSWRSLEAIARNLLDQPALEAVLVNCRDVTDKRRLEAELLQAQKMEVLGRLAGGIAHDFNNLLTVILSCSDSESADLPADHPLRADLDEIRKAGERAAALTRQLLTFSRKQEHSRPQQFCANRLVGDLARLMTRIVGEDVHIAAHLDESAPELLADPGQVEQVLMNLVINARDAMPQGGELTLSTRVEHVDGASPLGLEHRHGTYVVLSVTDTGSGIDPAILERIFEPFFTTKAAGHGTGLGLATCSAIASGAGGFIVPSSELGRGTTMAVYLPLSQPADETASRPPGRRLLAGGSERLLLIEDDRAMRELVAAALGELGYSVRVAADSAEAETAAVVQPFDLIVTDVVLPGAGVKPLVARLRELQPAARFLFVSGYPEETVREHGVALSDAPFLAKPFTTYRLAEKVRATLDA